MDSAVVARKHRTRCWRFGGRRQPPSTTAIPRGQTSRTDPKATHMNSTTPVSVQLPTTMAAPGIARRLVRQADETLPEDLTDVAALLTSELVTDSVLRCGFGAGRTGRAIGLRIHRSAGWMRVEVRDHAGRPSALATPPPADSVGQRIVAGLASQWGSRWEPLAGGTVVWFELDHRSVSRRSCDDRPPPGVPAPEALSIRRAGTPRVPRQR